MPAPVPSPSEPLFPLLGRIRSEYRVGNVVQVVGFPGLGRATVMQVRDGATPWDKDYLVQIVGTVEQEWVSNVRITGISQDAGF